MAYTPGEEQLCLPLPKAHGTLHLYNITETAVLYVYKILECMMSICACEAAQCLVRQPGVLWGSPVSQSQIHRSRLWTCLLLVVGSWGTIRQLLCCMQQNKGATTWPCTSSKAFQALHWGKRRHFAWSGFFDDDGASWPKWRVFLQHNAWNECIILDVCWCGVQSPEPPGVAHYHSVLNEGHHILLSFSAPRCEAEPLGGDVACCYISSFWDILLCLHSHFLLLL